MPNEKAKPASLANPAIEHRFSLRNGERALLLRALRIYMNFYQQLVGSEKVPGIKEEHRLYVRAGENLFNKLYLQAGEIPCEPPPFTLDDVLGLAQRLDKAKYQTEREFIDLCREAATMLRRLCGIEPKQETKR